MHRSIFLILIVFLVSNCKDGNVDQEKSPSVDVIPPPSGKSGQELSTIYCSSCHLYPDADLLDKKTWMKEVLPNMGYRLGIPAPGYNPFNGLTMEDQFLVGEAGIYAKTPKLAKEDWQKIVDYYQTSAPDTLKLSDNKHLLVKTGLPFFEIKKPDIEGALPITTLCQINEASSEIYIGNMQGLLTVLNARLAVMDTFHLARTPVHVVRSVDKNILDVICMGEMRPTDDALGSLIQIDRENHKHLPLLTKLKRPVYFEEIDLDNDGTLELIVCEFGNQMGKISWYHKDKTGWKEHILSKTPGASKVIGHDFDKDGRVDLAVLMAQGDEHISIYFNKGNNVFEDKVVLRFSPVYGSCDMQLIDFNQDGSMDFLYTNGDNADLSPILKPYHGIRLFLNDGQNNFSQTFFYPFYGAFQAGAGDFDLDGDVDIIASSFFPDRNDAPESSIIYLEQTSPMTFQPYTFKEAVNGKWLTLHMGDIDHDGDTDVIFSNFLGYERGTSEKIKFVDKKLPFLFLENTTR